jgi:hypothetical protein
MTSPVNFRTAPVNPETLEAPEVGFKAVLLGKLYSEEPTSDPEVS